MYRLFQQRPITSKGLVLFPDFAYARAGLRQQAAKVVQHYRVNKKIVRSDNILIRLINTVSCQYGSNPYRYVQLVADETTRIAMTLHLTSEATQGTVFHHMLFGQDSNEIIILNNDPFVMVDVEKKWMDLEPIKVLRHPHADTNMVVFNSALPSTYYDHSTPVDNTNLYIVSINLPMLMLQYALWYESLADNKIGLESTANFLATYPLLNMIHSYLDYAIFNRFANFVNGKGNTVLRNQHSFMVINYYDRIDRTLEGLFESFKTKRLDFATTLMSVPVIFEKDWFDTVFHSNPPQPTRQIAWAMNLAILPTISTLLKIDAANQGGEYKNPANTQWYNYLKIALKKLESDSTLDNQLPIPLLLETNRYLKTEIEVYLQHKQQ